MYKTEKIGEGGESMNKTLKISLKLLWDHVLFVILTLVFMPIFGWLIQRDRGILIYSYIMSFFYFMLIYSDIWEVARQDSRPHNQERPYVLKGLKIAILPTAVLAVSAAIYYAASAGFMNFDIVNFIYRLWMPMFVGFFEFYGEEFPAIFGLVVLVLPLASLLGYLAGMHKFSIQEKFVKFMNDRAKKNNE